ncbi:MAG: glycosyltransferase family 9 protein [Bacteroidia bacterium]|nr:glycosyltransferase family 9 protein [Bacteroidia bacterium]MDW8346045.1 glycosyltransferase family 9 protein [Bacteroidia bacterium]
MKVLVIQTAFIGDVVLMLPVVQTLKLNYPNIEIHVLVRQGNEELVQSRDDIDKVWIWNKKQGKIKNLLQLIRTFRKQKYDKIINLHRFLSTGIITLLSGAKETFGFDKNPFSRFFTHRIPHIIAKKGDVSFPHEVDRNLSLLKSFCTDFSRRPVLALNSAHIQKAVQILKKYHSNKYICAAPTSVWYTKQWHKDKWIEFFNLVPREYTIFLLGSSSDYSHLQEIKSASTHPSIINLAGALSFLESAALMKYASMVYVNDSAPLHFASSVNAPTTAIFCSTIPEFGFTPLADVYHIIQVKDLPCRPCGLHGRRNCPLHHFHCATQIPVQDLLNTLPV